jgi:phosphate transport system protein
MQPMRTAFHERLAQLDAELGEMCGLAGVAMKQATQALLEADVTVAEPVITDYGQMVAKRAQAEKDVLGLLALQAPVAGELRDIIGSMQIVADAERMGALAVHVAKIARRRYPQHVLPEDVRGIFTDMGKVAVALGDHAKQVLISRDPTEAARLRDEDEAMNNLHSQLFTVLMDRDWEHGVAAAVDAALLGRFYERFADHAVEVGRRVVFMVTGALPPEGTVSTY